jgi:hypothetical protein
MLISRFFMSPRTLTVLLTTALFASLASLATAWRLPGDNRGYEPVQPIAYSHRQHAGDMKISCLYCHSSAERSRYAGIPAVSICMNCHRLVTAPVSMVEQEKAAAAQAGRKPQRIVSSELRKLYDAYGLDERLFPLQGPGSNARPVSWVKVHTLADFVRFDHSAHVTVGVTCQTCHGPVETMDRVRQMAPLTMGWCVNCHRDANEHGIGGKRVNASLDCTACHY